MSDLNPNISDYSSVQGPNYIAPEDTAVQSGSTGVDTGLSTIEKSKSVLVSSVAPMDFPILTPPSNSGDVFFAVVTVANDQGGPAATYLLYLPAITEDEIIANMLDKWSQNLDEIDQETRQWLNSPQYIAEQQIAIHGNQQAGAAAIDGIQSPGIPVAGNVYILNAIQTASNIIQINPTDQVGQSENQTDVAQILTIPLISAAFTLGAIGAAELTVAATGVVSNPFIPVIQMVQQIQAIGPQLVAGVLTGLNTLIAPLLYFSSWTASVSGMNQREQANNMAMAQNFAREALKILGNPAYVQTNIINRMPGAEQLSPEQRSHIEAFIKAILAGVALSLLYTVEVGKVHEGQFLGMTAEEFQGLMNGTIKIPSPMDPDFSSLNSQEQLKASLLAGLKLQLALLPSDEARAQAIEVIFDAITGKRSFESMLSVNQVFSDLLQGSAYGSNVNTETTPI